MIDGQPGSGKTTFVKRICYLWAQRFNRKANDKTGVEEYALVVPIILKFVKDENTLTDILTSQLPCLSICEICTLLRHQQTKPKETLLLLDGYDEYTGKSFIENVILKKESPDVLCITTSRAHAIEQIKRHSSRAVEQHVRLCGFSEEQVKQYVEQFCEYHNLSSQKGTELIKILHERPGLLDVAKIPIRTEMICVVWAVYGRLGDTLADLYEKFILHLVTHWDEKYTPRQFANRTEEEIWKANQPLLLKLGKLANNWTKHNNIFSMYSDTQLKDVLTSDDYDKIIGIGILIKSYPSSTVQSSKWSFPHLTFQEYFIAYLLGNDTKGDCITDFTGRCKKYQYRVLSKCELIFTFLVAKYPAVASKIITELLLKETDKTRCEELFDILSKQFEQIVNKGTDIPLPHYLNLDSHKKVSLKFLQALIKGDKQNKNLRQLSTENPMKFKIFLDILYINELKVTILNEEELKLVSQKIRCLDQLTSLSIESTVSFSSTGQENVMKNIQKKLKYLSITCPGALEAIAENIHRFTSLEQLHVEENSNAINKSHGQKILSSLEGNTSMKQVSFSVMNLDDIIIKENVRIKVIVHVKKLQKGTLKTASDMLTGDSTVALHTLDLCRNNLDNEGTHLGELVLKTSGLRKLILGDCNLKPKTMQEMVDAMTKTHSPCGVHTLDLGHYENCNRNNLHFAGLALGKLLKLMPDLQRLDLAECKLETTDFGDISKSLSETSTKLLTLNLGVNDLGGEDNEGTVRFLQHMPEVQRLKAGGPNNDDPIPAICKALDNGVLAKLSILDVSESCLTSKTISVLGDHLNLMNSLEILNLKGHEEVKQEDFNHIYKNIPPSLTHLNVCSDQTLKDETTDPNVILDNKYCFNKLLKLNVTLIESDQEMLQEQLENINPDITVYCNPKENIWSTFVMEKSDP